ncbi:MAG: response regulator [Spirochaetota bacterium]
MYSVFLVEDEIVVREGIRNSIPWASTPYSLSGEAPDGELALSMMKDIKPDILITDIKMPFMDGLELSRVIRKTQPWVKIIILSGHDEFSYAKEAISIGVEEYLLKPVSASDMIACLDKVAGKIEEEKKSRLSLENLLLQVRSTSGYLREKWLCELVGGFVNTGDAVERAREFGFDLIAKAYLVAVVELETEASKYSDFAAVKLIVNSLVHDREDVILFARSMDNLVLLFKQTGCDSFEETVYSLCQAVKHEVERKTGCMATIGIGSVVGRIAEIPLSSAEAEKALKHFARTGRRVIAGVADIETFNESDLVRLDGDPIAERLHFAKRGDIPGIVSHYMEIIGDKPIQSSLLGYYLLGDILVASAKLVEELGGKMQDLFPSMLEQEHIAEIVASRESFSMALADLLEKLIDFRDSMVTGKHHAMIQKAKQYIDSNYASQDISLHSVAAVVNVSPNHFSSIFSQETGGTFIEYLTYVRISRAKLLLLTTSMRSAEIAYEAGFSDPHYFSFIFKKNAGVSPREFRSDSCADH